MIKSVVIKKFLIIDTEHLYTKATQNIVGKFGKIYDWSIKSQIMGLTGAEAAVKIVELLNLPMTPEEYFKLAHEEYAIVMKETQLMPGNYLLFFLSDTEKVYRTAIENIAKRFGKKYTPEIQAKVIGTPERESSRIAVTEMRLPVSVDEFQIEFRNSAHQHFTHVPIMPGSFWVFKFINHNQIKK